MNSTHEKVVLRLKLSESSGISSIPFIMGIYVLVKPSALTRHDDISLVATYIVGSILILSSICFLYYLSRFKIAEADQYGLRWRESSRSFGFKWEQIGKITMRQERSKSGNFSYTTLLLFDSNDQQIGKVLLTPDSPEEKKKFLEFISKRVQFIDESREI